MLSVGGMLHGHTEECVTLISRGTVPSLLETSLFLIAVRNYVGGCAIQKVLVQLLRLPSALL